MLGNLCLLPQRVVGILNAFPSRDENLMVLRSTLQKSQDVGDQAELAVPPRL